MKYNLKRISDQVIVITGASSGIGLCTARMAARKGAKVVLAARSGESLRQLEEEINRHGEALCVPTDVSQEGDLRRLANEATQRFGRIDTWVNNAGTSIYGRLTEVPLEDLRRLFEINFWGVVMGSRIAVEHMGRQGGALINVGSVLSDRAFPLQGMYSASKHAVKGFTDALRVELQHDEIPLAVSLIQPTSIDTPFPQHARNYMEKQPRVPDPVYAPEVVAKAILHAAEHETRNLKVGGAAKALTMMETLSPRALDAVSRSMMFEQQKRDDPAHGRQDALYSASEDPRERGAHDSHVMESSLYTEAAKHPVATAAVAVGIGLTVAAWMRQRNRIN
jgi:short-subunit dehydrogenase